MFKLASKENACGYILVLFQRAQHDEKTENYRKQLFHGNTNGAFQLVPITCRWPVPLSAKSSAKSKIKQFSVICNHLMFLHW